MHKGFLNWDDKSFKIKIPRLVIAGTSSGCGKTTVANAVLSCLCDRGLKVQPFKSGPDYIDPMFHTHITGRKSANIDTWMMSQDTARYLFYKNSSDGDIAVMEGVMGLYDGLRGTSPRCSTADTAHVVKAPVILVVNASGVSLSIVPVIKGFVDFDKNLDIKGVILNNVKSESTYRLLKEIITTNTNIEPLGYLPYMNDISLSGRHLGLVPVNEVKEFDKKIERLKIQAAKTLDIEKIIKIAQSAPDLSFDYGVPVKPDGYSEKIRIGVAYDRAFNFYYNDNFTLLKDMGAELCFFSPLCDKKLPPSLNGLYIGGGFPEVFAQELSNNKTIMSDIKNKVEKGLMVYAECGGLMYLTENIVLKDGKQYDMTGIINAKSSMTSSLKRFGYVDVEFLRDNILGEKGLLIKGHEFHYSTVEPCFEYPYAYEVRKPSGTDKIKKWNCGFMFKNITAGYPHIHFWSNPLTAFNFMKNAERGEKQCIDCPNHENCENCTK